MRDKLLEKIELLRQRMVEIGLEHGLNHPDVLACSREIDELLNELRRMEARATYKSTDKKPYRLFVLENQAFRLSTGSY